MEIGRSLPDGGKKPDRIDDWMENAEVARKKAEEAATKATDAAKRAEDAAESGGNVKALTNEDLEGLLK